MGIVDDIGRAHANLIWLLDLADRLDEAVEAARYGVAVSNRLGLIRFFGAHMLCNEADCLFRLGRWDESERAVQRAEQVGSLGINGILEQELLGRLALSRGRFDEAAERLRPLAPLAERAVDIQFVVPVEASLALLAIWQGRPGQALEQLLAGIPKIDFSPEVRIGELYALGLRAAADVAELSVAGRSTDDERRALVAGDELLAAIRRRHEDVVAMRPVFTAGSEAWLLQCEAEFTRLHRRPDATAWVQCGGSLGSAWAVPTRSPMRAGARRRPGSRRGGTAASRPPRSGRRSTRPSAWEPSRWLGS